MGIAVSSFLLPPVFLSIALAGGLPRLRIPQKGLALLCG